MPVRRVVLCAIAGFAAGSHADIFEFTGGTNGEGTDFADHENWQINDLNPPANPNEEIPGPDDRIIIPDGLTCIISNNQTANSGDPDYTIDSMEVYEKLILATDVRLELENDDANCEPGIGQSCGSVDHSVIVEGAQVLLDEDSALYFSTGSHIISGDDDDGGEVTYNSSNWSAAIEIDDGVAVTNQLGFGQTVIDNTRGFHLGDTTFKAVGASAVGTFVNEGVVKAWGAVVFEDDIDIEDICGARWTFECNSSITVERNADELEGDFIGICGGELICKAIVATCGEFIRNGLNLSFPVAAANHYFSYVEFSAGDWEDCDNPCTTCPNTPDCTDPYEVDDDVVCSGCTCF